MAGCKREAGIRVFGEHFLDKVKSSEFHYKQRRNRQRNKLEDEIDQSKFTKLTDALLQALTTEAFQAMYDDLLAFVNESSERECLRKWIQWWYVRRELIFPVFRKHLAVPGSNLAEVVHASWENRREKNFSLIDACAFDVKESFELDMQFREFEKGTFKGAKGPNQTQRNKRRIAQDAIKSKRYADQIFEFSGGAAASKEEGDPLVTDPGDSHRADRKNQQAQSKKGAAKSEDTWRATKYRNKRNSTVERKVKSAISLKGKIKVKSFKDTPAGREFEVIGSKPSLQKEPYRVTISIKSECSCPDFLLNAKTGPCKHIIWLYLFVFKIAEGSDIIHQTSLTIEELTILLSTTEVEDKYVFKDRRPLNRYDVCKRLLNDDARNKHYEHDWKLMKKVKKPGKAPSCGTCKITIKEGMLCFTAKALYVPLEQEFVQEKLFHLCPKRNCVENFPFYTNLVFLGSVTSAKDITPEERVAVIDQGMDIN